MRRHDDESKPEKATKRDGNLNTQARTHTHTHPIYAVSLAAHLIFGLLYGFYGWRKCTCIGVVLEQVVGAIEIQQQGGFGEYKHQPSSGA